MKRALIAGGVLAALVFGTVGYAYAQDQTVTVTAGVTPAFSMTINKNAVTLTAAPESGPQVDSTTAIQVKSNKLWNFSKTENEDLAIADYLSESTSVLPANGLARGVTDITCTYTLNTSLDSQQGWTVPAGTYTSTYTYSAVQQP